MAWSDEYVGGVLIVQGNKVRVNSSKSGGYTELTCNEPVKTATWNGADVIVVTVSGKAYRYLTNGTYKYA